jgi:HSP20 family molecular chaperone IbpA
MATVAARLHNATKPMHVSKALMSCRATPKAEFPARIYTSGNDGGSFDCEPIATRDLLPPATITETEDTLRILIPLYGVDLRHVYVIATARSIIVEIRMKNRIDHEGVAMTEVQEQRMIRELKFLTNIEERTTGVRVVRGELEITCTKADSGDDRGWSDLMHFDTRASLGCI